MTIPRLRPDEVVTDRASRFSDLARRWVQAVTQAINGEQAVTLQRVEKAKLGTPSLCRGQFVIVTDDVGGETPAWCDGTAWRRVTDRAEIV